ncbi:hypothetical protein SpCBS45565_g08410 [Spizellomyces sp. 'palustris']|nr:hypothetical protein SpCBS45565_g08410 [Spizellomyces sp. 'palustris']
MSASPKKGRQRTSSTDSHSSDVSVGDRRRSRIRAKFHRSSVTGASDLGSETSGSVYSVASTIPASLPPINRMAVLRTPDSCFKDLDQFFPYIPHYFKVGPMRVHYVDEYIPSQSSNGVPSKTVVLLHGALTWSYLYRKMITPLVQAGVRVIALDLPGHGKSDKLTSSNTSLLHLQVAAVRHFLTTFFTPEMDVTLVAHGWGGTVASITLAEMGEFQNKVTRLVLMNTFLPPHQEESTGREIENSLLAATWFYCFRTMTSVSTMIRSASAVSTRKSIGVSESRGYDAPYPTLNHRQAPSALPRILPLPLFSDPLILRIRELAPFLNKTPMVRELFTNNADVEVETEKAKLFLADYAKRVRTWVDGRIGGANIVRARERALVIWGRQDRLWGGLGTWFADLMGCRCVYLDGAGHYLPEDDPTAVVEHLLEFIKN